MKKLIVIPTDFSTQSLEAVHTVMGQYIGQYVHVKLLHLVNPPKGLSEILFGLNTAKLHNRIPSSYTAACEMMVNHYGKNMLLLSSHIAIGTSASALRNIVEDIIPDAIFFNPELVFEKVFEESEDIYTLIKTAGIDFVTVTSQTQKNKVCNSAVSNLLVVRN